VDDEQASARRLVAPAWLPQPFKSSGAELTTPIHATRHSDGERRRHPARCRVRTILGSNVPWRSRGASIPTFPCAVANVLGVVPLRVLPVPPGGASPCS
jgi:hypothetical protein